MSKYAGCLASCIYHSLGNLFRALTQVYLVACTNSPDKHQSCSWAEEWYCWAPDHADEHKVIINAHRALSDINKE